LKEKINKNEKSCDAAFSKDFFTKKNLKNQIFYPNVSAFVNNHFKSQFERFASTFNSFFYEQRNEKKGQEY
jgi:hypothetical protein